MNEHKQNYRKQTKKWRNRLMLMLMLTFLCSGASAMPVTVGQDLLLPTPDGVGSDDDGLVSVESAESFSVVTAFGVETIRWWGVYDPEPVADDFTVRVLGEDGAGLPDNGNVVFESSGVMPLRTSTGQPDIFDGEIFEYLFAVPAADAFDLAIGDYWLVIVNRTLVPGLDTQWFWTEGVGGDGINAVRDTSEGPAWSLDNESFDLAFEIAGTALPSGEIPLAPVWMLMFGPALLLASRARRR